MENFKDYLLQKGFAPKTIRSTINVMTTFQKWCKVSSVQLETLRYNELMRYVEECRKSENIAYVRMKIKCIDHYFNYLNQTQTAPIPNPSLLVKFKGLERYIPRNLLEKEELTILYNLQHTKGLTGKRDKVILSLLVFQGVGRNELERIELKDIDLMEGKMYIAASRGANSRTLDLKPFQLLLLQDYILNIRKTILEQYQRESDKLILTIKPAKDESLSNVVTYILKSLRVHYPKLRSLQHIRQSLIRIWINEEGLRQAQYKAGHKYISSTERYNEEKFEGLKMELDKHFPL